VDFSAPILLCYISLKESRYSFANAPQRIGAEKVLKHASSGIMGINFNSNSEPSNIDLKPLKG
ncbi:hypothetical protein JQC92_13805, partial [Shewanella sp. 202IG2-18]|uniref:hypothetical protein n=1 Tax=Parashewanella hymeniacidonis TaxID=2807618 RepID=UPI00196174C8